MRKSVRPSRLDGGAKAPPSKSVMQRVVAAGLLAEGQTTRVLNPSDCDDARAALRVAAGLGAEVDVADHEVVIRGRWRPRRRVLDCGESGLCLRLYAAIASLWPGALVLTGQASLLRRPVEMVEGPLRDLGVTCRTASGFPPIRVQGPLSGGTAAVDGSVSSQFLSGLLMALPLAGRDSRLTVRNLRSRPYIDLTLQVLSGFGIMVKNEQYEAFHVRGGQRYSGGVHEIEGDWSAAAPLLVAAAVSGRASLSGLRLDSAQADSRILAALRAAGAQVTAGDAVTVERKALRAFDFDATDSPDLLPPLAALACHCSGTSRLFGAVRLRQKESDRAAVLCEEFGRLGARLAVVGDVIEVQGGSLGGGTVRSHGDHRIAMALAAAGMAARALIVIESAECVAKSYPGFFLDLATLGGRIDE